MVSYYRPRSTAKLALILYSYSFFTFLLTMRLEVFSFMISLFACEVDAFVSSMNSPVCAPSSTRKNTCLSFGIFPSSNKDNTNDKYENDQTADAVEKKSMSISGLIQLITAGMGAPFLGDFEGVDQESGKLMFSLEANNFVDEKGNSKQTQAPYFENGWVDEKDLKQEQSRKEKGGFRLW